MSSQNLPQPSPDNYISLSRVSIDSRHLLLRDFIADISDDDIARLAREIEGEGMSR
jgi:hypothetical protein